MAKQEQRKAPQHTQPDDLKMNPDGTATLRIAGVGYRLRRPVVREYRKALEVFNEAQDETARLRREARDTELAPPAEDAKPAEVEAAATAEARRVASKVTDDIWKAVWGAYDEVFGMLADKEPPEDHEEWPAFLLGLQPLADLLSHWRSVPSAPGPA